MAPKSRASAKAAAPRAKTRGGAKAAASSAQAAPASALEVVQQEEAAVSGTRPAKRLRRRNTDEVITKCLKDNFASWDAHLTDGHMVEGKTLRQTLAEHRRMVNAGNSDAPTLGKLYYEKLRDKFAVKTSPNKMLVATDRNEPLDRDLEKALVGLNQHIKRYDLIHDFLEKGPMVNQLSLVVLLKHSLKISPKSGKEGLSVLMSLLGWISRHKVKEGYPNERSHVKPHLDEALTRSWLSFKTSGLAARTWWHGVKNAASLVMDEDKVDELVSLGREDEWSAVEGALASVVQDSMVGKSIFGGAFAKLMREKVSAVVDEHVANLASGNITEVSLAENRAAFLQAMKDMNRDPMEPQPLHDIDLRYRVALVVATVCTVYEEYCLKVDAYVRGLAVDLGVLPPLLCENSLVPVPPLRAVNTVAASVVAVNKKAREAVEELLRGKVQSAFVVQTILQEKKNIIRQLDRSFRLEIAFFASVSGPIAELRLRDEVLKVLPTLTQQKSTTETITLLRHLGNQKLLEFVGVGLQATFRSVISIIEAIDLGKPPAFDGSVLSPFMAAVMDQVALFCRIERSSGAKDQRKTYVGKEAAVKIHEELLAKESAKVSISLNDLKPLIPFTWLVDATVTSDIKKWTNAVTKADLVAGATAAMASGSKAGSQASRKRSTPDSRALVLACLDD